MTQGRTAQRWLGLGLGICLALGAVARADAPSDQRPLVYYNNRNFRVPVAIPAADVARYKQVYLLASTNRGGDWTQIAATTPDSAAFSFRAQGDGEIWFAAQVMDQRGRLFPGKDADIAPNMKVMIDTKKPSMVIEPRARIGSKAAISWDVTDENLDLDTLAFSYQVARSKDWTPVPLTKQARIGMESWDAGTAEPVQVRGTVLDKAKNRQTVFLQLPGGGVPDDVLNAAAESPDSSTPPPIGTFASTEGARSASAVADIVPGAAGATVGAHDPFSDGGGQADAAGAARDSIVPPIVVASPRFALQYAVDDAGPSGPAVVELYITADDGRTWTNRGGDPDRRSPFDVDLGGEGRFGLKLVAKSAADQGDRPPVPGEAPRTVVEVDATGPVVTLAKPTLTGNRLVITWKADDVHPSPRSVMISIRADAPGSRWKVITPTPIDNTGQYQWIVPASCPPKVHVRVDVRDALNNLGFAETPEDAPVLVDRSKPKGRILGLDPVRPAR